MGRREIQRIGLIDDIRHPTKPPSLKRSPHSFRRSSLFVALLASLLCRLGHFLDALTLFHGPY